MSKTIDNQVDVYLEDDFKFDKNVSDDLETISRESLTYWQDAFRRLKKNKAAIASCIILILMIVMTIIGPYISGYSYTEVDPMARNQTPSAEHWFGTDSLGRDLFARTWIAGRVSMAIGVIGALVNITVGLIYGGVAGYIGGGADKLMMRIVEVIGSVPKMLVIILISMILKPTLTSLILALTLTGWIGAARMVRSQVLQLKNFDFVHASIALGSSPWRIIKKHMFPNVMSTLIIITTLTVPGLIFAEAFLSFIGLGIQSPNTSWGAMCAESQQMILFYPYQLLVPTILISITMLCFNLLGDGLRDALDPKLRK